MKFSPCHKCWDVVEAVFPCWPAFLHPWTGVKDGSSLVATCEFAQVNFQWPHCFSLLMGKAQEHS